MGSLRFKMGFESPCFVCLFSFINDIFSRLLFLHSTVLCSSPSYYDFYTEKAFLVLMYTGIVLEADGITSVSVQSCQLAYENQVLKGKKQYLNK